MLRRLLRTAEARGLPGPELLEGAFRRAMAPRLEHLDDDHDPRFLHPGRVALILLDDVGLHDGAAVATGVLAETESPELAVPDASTALDPPELQAALNRARSLPAMEEESLAERLLSAPATDTLIALAEHLDQLRHLRLWADPERVRRRGDLCARVLVPIADRAHPVLARRFRWWARRVAGAL